MRSRREFLTAAAALILTGCASRRPHVAQRGLAPSLPQAGEGSLQAHAAAHGLLYGCAVDVDLLSRDEGYAGLVREQASMIVAENAMNWAPLRPAPDRFHFEDADALIAFAEANRMKVRGHTLCWHRQLPAWFGSYATKANARDLLEKHIETVVGRYAGRMHSWDVVNEAIQPSDNRPDGLRHSPWLELIGEDYVERAFRAARDADPQALLTYNDYGIEAEDPASASKRAALLQLLRRLKARHVPVDAVGIQAHLRVGGQYGSGLRGFMAECRRMDLQVFLTELDVNDGTLPPDVETRDAAVAETYKRFLDVALADPVVRVVLTWGITDRRTWLNAEDARPDRKPQRSLPFGLLQGQNDAPRAAFFAMRKSFDDRARM